MKFGSQLEVPVVTSLPTGQSGGIVVFNSVLYLFMTGAWTPVGVVASAAGSTTQIQFNNVGVTAGNSGLTFDTTSNTLGLLGADTGLNINAITNEPATPTGTNIRLYTKTIAGRGVPKWKETSGNDNVVATAIWDSTGSIIIPGITTTIQAVGCAVTAVGTVSTPTITSTSLRNQTKRFTLTSAITAAALASLRVNAVECYSGNAAGLGGYFVVCRFALSGTLQTGMRAFVGLTDTPTTAATNIDPTTSTTPGKIGMAINASTGNWNLVNNITGAAPTVLALGANFPVNTTDMLELILFCAPNATSISYRVKNFTSGLLTSGTLSTNIPANTTFLGRVMWACNNTIAGAVAIDCSKFYLETSY